MYTCPECHECSPSEEWKLTSVYCEDCGDHSALRCPRCEEDIDMAMHENADEEFPNWRNKI